MLDQTLLLEPLLRYMPLPPSLARHAPLSKTRRLRSFRLRDTPLADGVPAEFDDSCLVTVAEDMDVAALPIKLVPHGGRKRFKDVHLTVLSTKGQVQLTLGDDHAKVFIGSETSVRAGIHLFRRPTVFIGDHTTIAPSRLTVHHGDLVIGEDCQLGDDVLVQTNDPHVLMDLASGEVLNGERSRVYLGRHVLVQRRAMLLPGVRIGDGAVVQTGSVVSGEVMPNTWVGGAPAALLREGVRWERSLVKARESASPSGDAS